VNRVSLSLLVLDVPAPAHGRVRPARCPGRVLLWQVPFGQTASLRPSAAGSPAFVRGLHRYYSLSDFPYSFTIGVRP